MIGVRRSDGRLASLTAITSRIRAAHMQELVWVVTGQAFAIAGAIAGIKILTTLLPPEGYGELALGVALASGIAMLVFGPLNQIVYRYYSTCAERGELPAFYAVLRRLHMRAGVALLVIAGTASVLLYWMAGARWAMIVGIALLFALTSGLQGSGSSLQNALRDRKSAALTQALDPWLRLTVAVFFCMAFAQSGVLALAAFVVGSSLVLFLQWRWLRARITASDRNMPATPNSALALQRQFVHYGLPFVGFGLFALMGQYLDRWILQTFASLEAVGIYAAMMQIATAPVAALVGVATQLIVPVVFAKAGAAGGAGGQSAPGLVYVTALLVAIMSALFALAAYLWGRELLVFFANERYAGQAAHLWIIVLAVAAFNCAQILVAHGLSLNQSSIYLMPKALQALSLIVFGIWLAPVLAIQGISLALLAAAVLYLLSVCWVNSRLRAKPAETI